MAAVRPIETTTLLQQNLEVSVGNNRFNIKLIAWNIADEIMFTGTVPRLPPASRFRWAFAFRSQIGFQDFPNTLPYKWSIIRRTPTGLRFRWTRLPRRLRTMNELFVALIELRQLAGQSNRRIIRPARQRSRRPRMSTGITRTRRRRRPPGSGGSSAQFTPS